MIFIAWLGGLLLGIAIGAFIERVRHLNES